MYRIITGACRTGTDSFIDSLNEIKDNYTIQEIIDITEGQYDYSVFKRFFNK